MTALLEADPVAVRRAAAALDGTAEEASRLGRQLDRQRPPCWRSPSNRDYVTQLSALGGRVDRIVRSHDEAAEVLAAYARVLEEAQDRARYARSLHEEGARRSAQWAAQAAAGPDPGWALTSAAERTQQEATTLERAAAVRTAGRLRELAASAPEQDLTSKVLRPLEDVAVTTVEGVRGAPAGFAALTGAAWSAVPGFHGESEQREGRATLAATARFWEGWVEAARDAAAGRPGLAAGAFAGGLPKRISTIAPDPSREKVGGFLAGIKEGRLTVDDIDEAWDQAHAARSLQDRILEMRARPLPDIEQLVTRPVDLALHERSGSHTILKHVGASIEMLRARIALEGSPARPVRTPRTTFPDLATAEELVGQALAEHADLLRDWAADASSKTIDLPSTALPSPVGTVVHPGGPITTGTQVNVTLVKDGDGFRILTAFIDDKPRAGRRRR